MQRSLLTAASGMKAQQLQVDTIANNIANANTTGFKKNALDFRALFYQTLRQPGAAAGPSQMDATGLQVGSGVEVAGSRMTMTQGAVELTGGRFDLAIQGNGFFEVQLPSGESRYTRDGALRVDGNGDLVTADGYYVLPRTTFPSGVSEIQIAPTGEISYLDDVGEVQALATMQITTFPNALGLRMEGANLYAETPSSGTPTPLTPGSAGAGVLVHGALERSNVQTVDELVGLIVAQRSYEVNSRAIQVSDEMLQQANQIIR
jgi:flagellar basal-body rod protein FlgG